MIDPKSHECSECGAWPGDACISRGGTSLTHSHPRRGEYTPAGWEEKYDRLYQTLVPGWEQKYDRLYRVRVPGWFEQMEREAA